MNKKNELLIVFTSTYPYSAVGESFLEPEINYLSQNFDKIIIVPKSLPKEKETINRQLPKNVYVEKHFINLTRKNEFSKIKLATKAIKSPFLYKEAKKDIRHFFSLSGLKKIVVHIGIAIQYKEFIKQYIEQENIDLSKTLFYTYWLGPITLGVGLAKYNHSNIKLISRAHRGDLYFEMDKLPPYYMLIISLVDSIFLISQHGKKYIQQICPEYSSKYKVSKLGTPEQNIETEQSKDGIFRIVSCSYLVPVKRIELLIESLKEIGLKKSNYSFEWNHIGYGPLETKLKEKSLELPDNVSHSFLGFLDDESFLLYYKNNPVDVFINVSSSEGIPVSIMEAQSFGIPVIATDVGGVSEIVSNSVGVLLSPNPDPKDIAQAICKFLDNPSFMKEARLNSKDNWSRNYDAKKNYTEFARTLEDL